MSQANNGRDLGVATSKPTLDGLTVGGTALGTVAIVDLGQASTDLVGFHGVTAIAQAATLATFVAATAATTSAGNNPDVVALIAAVNAIQTVLHNKGLTG